MTIINLLSPLTLPAPTPFDLLIAFAIILDPDQSQQVWKVVDSSVGSMLLDISTA